eukprot:161836-Amphidinium_carterae.1
MSCGGGTASCCLNSGRDSELLSQFTAMKFHGKHFARLSESKKQEYGQRALQLRSTFAERNRCAVIKLEEELDMEIAKQEQRERDGSSMLFSICALCVS